MRFPRDTSANESIVAAVGATLVVALLHGSLFLSCRDA
jgi:hypothetical protein